MPNYMTQKMSYAMERAIVYYRKTSAHPSHTVSSAFTTDAKNAYAALHGIDASEVELGTYRSGQGVPSGRNTEEI